MLLCSGPLTNTIQSWVKPSTVGFFLTWARCPSSSFTWTAHCGGERRGAAGERPRTRGWAGGRGGTGPTAGGGDAHGQNGTASPATRKPAPRARAWKSPRCHREGAGRRGRLPAVPSCGRGQRGAAVRDAPSRVSRPPPRPRASALGALGAPGAAAGTQLRRHPPPSSG